MLRNTGISAVSRPQVRGSPFDASVITLRPEASRCEVKGEALYKAIARLPQRFDISFVDAMGHTAHAEEVWSLRSPDSDYICRRQEQGQRTTRGALIATIVRGCHSVKIQSRRDRPLARHGSWS